MSEVINRTEFYLVPDDLLDSLNDLIAHENGQRKNAMMDVRNRIMEIPRIQAEPVKVSYWKFASYERFACVDCGFEIPSGCSCVTDAQDKLDRKDHFQRCPSCGAFMIANVYREWHHKKGVSK